MLKRFLPDGQCLLSAGDMLYLPPEFAHEGIAVGACYTYSIGFRAPSERELISQFLIFLEEKLARSGRYADPDLTSQAYPAHIGAGMLTQVERVLGEISWTRGDVAEFLGTYLTEPKPNVLFAPPRRARSQIAFSTAARRTGVELALPSLMLYANATLFLNGEALKPERRAQPALRRLADTRRLPGRLIPSRGPVTEILYRWYRAGYIYLSESAMAG
jgi:50S ribosomal protein L16 3-hydroxylase